MGGNKVGLNKDARQTIVSCFESFDNENIRYVILRGYRDLPESIIGSDIDLYVHPEDYSDFIYVISEKGFEKESLSTPKRLLSIAHRGVNNPVTALSKLATSPTWVIRTIFDINNENQITKGTLKNQVYEQAPLYLHAVNAIAYKSPLDGTLHRVNKEVENQLVEYRQEKNGFYKPAPPDELAHLVCRGVFDKNGEFSEIYKQKCNSLYKKISGSEAMDERFQGLLRYLFFKSDELVYKLICKGEYNKIRDSLEKFADY